MSMPVSGSDGDSSGTELDGAAQSSRMASSSSTLRIRSISITQRTIWLAAVLVVAILAGIVIVDKALGPLILLLLAMIIGEAVRPVVVRLERYHIPRAIGTLLIFLIIIVALVGLSWLLINPLVGEIGSLAHNLPHYQAQLQKDLDDLGNRLKAQGSLGTAATDIAGSLAAALRQSAPALIAIPFGFLTGIFGIFIDLVVILTMTIFWLLSAGKLRRFIVSLFPQPSQDHASSVMLEIGTTFGGYVRGTLASMVIIGTLTGAGLALLGVPYALLLGLLAALTELLPYLGPWISGSISVVFALIAVGPLKSVEVIILFILIQELEGNVVQPLVMSRTVHIDPLLVIVSVLVGINLLGIIGAVLAVPIAAGIQVLVVRVVAPAVRRASSGQGTTLGTGDITTAVAVQELEAPEKPLSAPPEPPRPAQTAEPRLASEA
jgi:predicted PurR-regulated permease PerM